MPKLYLIPNILSDNSPSNILPGYLSMLIKNIRIFFVEEPKSARALLKKIDPEFPLSEAQYINLNEHVSLADIEQAFYDLQGKDMAVISEAGYPCVADPGSALVRLAHQIQMQVIPLAGASSITLALAASGLNGQNFAFNGYLPRDRHERMTKIRALEQRSKQEGQTQIMMEAPYRSQSLLDDLLASCSANTLLCVACDITGGEQVIQTMTIKEWKHNSLKLQKLPTLFLLLYN